MLHKTEASLPPIDGRAGDIGDSRIGFCVDNGLAAGSSRFQPSALCISWVAEVAERAACDSCLRASGTTAAEVCDGGFRDAQEVAAPLRGMVLGCSSSTDIHSGCCYLEALLTCHDPYLTPVEITRSYEKLITVAIGSYFYRYVICS